MSKTLIIFIVVSCLAVGAVIVYAMNNMDSTKNDSQVKGDITQNSNQPSSTPTPNYQPVDFNRYQNSPNQKAPAGSNQTNQTNQANQTNPSNQQVSQQAIPTGPITKLLITDLISGSGAEVKNGDSVEVNYNGTLMNGQKFDSSYDRNQTFSFKVGSGNVIRGWDEGLIGMKTGGKRQLVIPPDLAYGQTGVPGTIPPNSPLVFEIELVAIKPSE